MKTYYRHGAHNVICDRTGYKIKSTEARKTWDGLTVKASAWEPRHPQDFLRSIPDDQSVRDPNPEADDYFVSDNEVQASDL